MQQEWEGSLVPLTIRPILFITSFSRTLSFFLSFSIAFSSPLLLSFFLSRFLSRFLFLLLTQTLTSERSMTATQRLYRLTQTTLTRIHHHSSPPKPLQTTSTKTTTPHPLINLENLTSFAAGVLLHEHETIPLPNSDTSPRLTSKEVTKKCNVLEWEAKLSGRKPHLNDDHRKQEEAKEEPPLPTSRAGVIFVSTTSFGTTTSMDEDNVDRNQESGADSTTNKGKTTDEDEKITSFLFARYESSIPELQARLKTDLLPPPLPNQLASDIEDPDSLTSVPSRIQKLIESRGVTRVWLCGTDPAFRRHRLMSTHLKLLEQEVLQWKKSDKTHHEERVSGVVTAHTVPLRFPGMIQFLIKNGFKGGDRIKTSEDKVFYWKEI
ncbi:MAG: hypothetical protein J3R72DRAFT_71617 [Linnemannia gamsii]|nr:MAG: hypothetical protein J3R72DRAFT_71617 [Linnemannia gamsii]